MAAWKREQNGSNKYLWAGPPVFRLRSSELQGKLEKEQGGGGTGDAGGIILNK
jgi:hypothetical protein